MNVSSYKNSHSLKNPQSHLVAGTFHFEDFFSMHPSPRLTKKSQFTLALDIPLFIIFTPLEYKDFGFKVHQHLEEG